jgi:pyridoxal phosphate enzyme (YggS family)
LAIGRFHLIHSIDGVRIAQTLDRLGGEREQKSRVLVQVNTSEETAKHGLPGEELVDALGEIAGLGWLEVMGLMTIGPATMDPAATRACFRGLRTLRDRAERGLGVPLPELSMGMSADFEIAIEEGATIVRLGRILTGERAPKG